MSNANHLCDNEYNETTIENGFAQQRINICFVNREARELRSCVTEANAIQNRSNTNSFLVAAVATAATIAVVTRDAVVTLQRRVFYFI